MKTNNLILVSVLLVGGLGSAGCGEDKTVVVPGGSNTTTTTKEQTTIVAPSPASTKTDVNISVTGSAAPAASPGR